LEEAARVRKEAEMKLFGDCAPRGAMGTP
jgi:hypothetical protein